MANISVWIFDSENEAKAHAEAAGGAFIGPAQLSSVDVVDRSGGGTQDEYFKNFPGKWGVAILG